ncbi:MAG: carboxypeptidase regulatory-like domain-containing protein, partial [Gemmatimonadetes bacterium]|nr:carboxypeptidase regulatory-like domain-containing protein [Gemmatimonadota bacterium]
RRPFAGALLALATLAPAHAHAQQGQQRGVVIPRLYTRYVPGPSGPVAADSSGLRFRLDAAVRGDVTARPRVTTGRLLTVAESQRLLARLAPLTAQPAPADSFAFPAQTLAPPRAGRVVAEPFPARDTAAGRPVRPGVQAAPMLSVIRQAPQGEVDTGAEVTITFSQPMVPLGSVADVAAQAVPARITPQPPGRWRWIDARTLKFEPRGRLPMATVYTVEVPAGARSATGSTMAEGARWTFSTPPARAIGSLPQGEPTGMNPVLAIAFDQRIDPAAVLRTITLTADGVSIPVRLATAQEIAAEPDTRAVLDSQEPGRWLAFRAVRPLPKNAAITVAVGPGTPSAEGPRTTTVRQYWQFRTYGPLRIQDENCGCRPGSPIFVELSNPLDTLSFRPSMVTVSPAIPHMLAWVSGSSVIIHGETAPRTKYTISLSPALRDTFQQTLGPSRPVTVQVGAPYASLDGPEGMYVLDPLAERAVSMSAAGHHRVRLRVTRVRPEDWAAFNAGPVNPSSNRRVIPGTPVVDRVITLDSPMGESREVRVDLAPALTGGVGNAVIALEALDGEEEWERDQAVYTWVQATRIGLAAYSDADSLVAWATSLVDGAPIPGAQVRLEELPGAAMEGTTDARGLATLALPEARTETPRILVARAGNDVAFLANGVGGYARWSRNPRSANAAMFFFTDRGLYRPGETVRFKGWVRRISAGRASGPELLRAGELDSVTWTAFDARHNQVAQGVSHLTALGGFDGAFTPPAGSNLGGGTVEVRFAIDGSQSQFNFNYSIQEFRRPEYTVTATASEGPHFVGGSAEITARAAYFAGGGLPSAPVHWVVTASPGFYTPPGWDEWTFGSGIGIWRGVARPEGATRTGVLDAVTNAAGENVLRISFDSADPPRPYVVSAQGTVTDVNRQTWSADASLLVHPAAVYVGLRPRKPWLVAGDSIDLDVVAVDLDGKPVAGRTLDLRVVRRYWSNANGTWQEMSGDSAACARVSDTHPVRCVFRAAEPGTYEITAETRDAQGRPAQTSTTIWVTGRGFLAGPRDENGERNVELVPDRKTYAVGDTAHILVRTGFTPSRGLLTLRRNGIARTEEVRIDGNTSTFAIPITEADVPNVWVQLDLVGAADGLHGEAARGVLFAVGMTNLSVPPVTRVLAVHPLPRDSATTPDAQTAVAVEVKDAAGRPVPNAEVALVVVDESVLALSGYDIPNPIDAFYPQRQPGVQELRLRTAVHVEEPDFPPAPHTLVGRVVDARNGGYLGGATVTVEGTALRDSSDEFGRFRISGVPAGSHTLVVAMDGYATARERVTVTEAAPPPFRISLVPQRLAEMEVMENRMGGVQLQGVVATARGNQDMVPPEAPPPPPPPPPPPAPAAQAPKAGGPSPAPIAVRSNFDALALFSPAVRTDANGRAEVPFKLPSNLTRYRVTAVAVAGGTQYGVGESAITARQPLMVRPSAPRFLNWGDRFELPVVVQNQTGAPVEVDVAARGLGVSVTETGRHVTVPAHDRVEVRLAAEAAQAGPARFQVAAATPTLADAAEGTLPVYTPATTEAFATYGTFAGDSAVTLPLQVPGDAIPSFGGLDVTTSSTALQELTDALLYLVRYPYECAEQISSRMLGVTALRDVLYAFKTQELPAPDSLRASVEQDVRALAARQNDDGGFGFWVRGQPSFPYVSIHAAHALQRAREKGYAVPDEVWQRSLRYLRNVPGNVPPNYPADVRRALQAYATYVRARMGDAGAADAVRRMMAATPHDSITVEEAGWLLSAATGDALPAERAELLRIIGNRATETASTATFATRYTEGEYLLLHSQRRTDGVVLEALVGAQPDNPLIPKVVRGLLGHRVQGRWDNTQENAWVLIALDRYFHAFEGQTPEFVARLWLGDRYVGSHSFSGRQADRALWSVPMRVLQGDRPNSLTIGKEGPGRLYWRAGVRYAPRDLDLLPLDAGFVVSRTYEAVDDPRDVTRGADGHWKVKAGARVRVTLTMTAPSRRLHVALADPLPAGFEPVNPELNGTQDAPPPDAGPRPVEYGSWWRAYWYQHQNLRDDRAEAFTSLLPAGTYTYSYVARATTPGQFIVPPPHAEEMYTPETFGRGRTERVDIIPSDQQ